MLGLDSYMSKAVSNMKEWCAKIAQEATASFADFSAPTMQSPHFAHAVPAYTPAQSAHFSSQDIAGAVSVAIERGFDMVSDAIFEALPTEIQMNIDSRQIASAAWAGLESEGVRRGRLFAPTHEQITVPARS